MLIFTKDLLKEILIVLVMVQVVGFLIPKQLKIILRNSTRLLSKVSKGITLHIRTYVRNLKVKKVTPTKVEQPSNIITVKFSNGITKQYHRKAK